MDPKHHVKLGPYTLKRRIGAGGMAEVWMAEREIMGAYKNVAVKLLNSISREKDENREMFLDEARLSMALSHSSIVSVFDVGEYAGECFIIMEWIDGLNLAELTAALWEQGETLPLHVSTYIVGEVLRALDHAHNVESHGSTGIVHRDISPQNVMLSVGGEVKLMDFGVARFSTEHTTGRFLKGKIRYMPPEQAKLQSRSPSIDLFAVGAVLYELIEGRRFRAPTTNEIELLTLAMGGVVPPLTKREHVPDEILHVLDGLLEISPKLRIGSARGALRMLSEWSGYKNAALELEAIIARFHGRNHREGEASVATSVSAAHQLKARIDAYVANGGPGAQHLSPSTSAWRGVNASTETSLQHLDSEAVDDTSVGSIWARRSPRATRGAALALAILALGVGSTTAWFAGDALSDAAPTPEPELAAASAPEASTLEPQLAAEPVPEPAPVEAEDDTPKTIDDREPSDEQPVADETTDDVVVDELDDDALVLAPDDDAGDTPSKAPPPPEPATKPKPRQKVDVTFIANQFYYAKVKIRSRELTLQPSDKTQLREGWHTVKLLDAETGKWVKAGRIQLRPDHRYEVRMTKPHGLKLRELD